MKYIHINCDLGEGGGRDEEIMPLISACNIACGGHAGTVKSMMETVHLALENQVEIGAHPSYPDKENFGRRSLEMAPADLRQTIIAQILSLKQIAEAEGGKLTHVKPHGALYNDAAKDKRTAEIILDSMLEFDEKLSLYAPRESVISKLAEGKVEVIFEAFADRNYSPNYQLISRLLPNALITQKEAVYEHLLSMFLKREIILETGEKIPCFATTFCLHSDTPNSVDILKYLDEKLRENDIKILHS